MLGGGKAVERGGHETGGEEDGNHGRETRGEGIVSEKCHRAGLAPINQRGFLSADFVHEAGDDPVAGLKHLTRGLGVAGLVAVEEGDRSVSDEVEGQGREQEHDKPDQIATHCGGKLRDHAVGRQPVRVNKRSGGAYKRCMIQGFSRMRRRHGTGQRLALVGGMLLLAEVLGGVPRRLAAEAPVDFAHGIRPLLETYCFKCHGPAKQKSHINFSLFNDDSAAARQRKLWRKSIDQVAGREMPPDDEEKQPTDEERARLVGWMKGAVAAKPEAGPLDPGPSVIRRLSLAEYDNTVRDLLGVEFDSASLVGATDEAGTGNTYGNLAAALDIAPSLMDKYFAAADKVLDRLFETDLSTAFDGTPRERARAAREKLFGVKPGSWKKPSEAPKLPEGKTERQVATEIVTSVVGRAYRGLAREGDVSSDDVALRPRDWAGGGICECGEALVEGDTGFAAVFVSD